jgi:hypothetical protein
MVNVYWTTVNTVCGIVLNKIIREDDSTYYCIIGIIEQKSRSV